MIHFPTTHSWTEFSLQYVKQALWVTNPALDICSGIRSAFHTGLQSCPVLPKSSHTSDSSDSELLMEAGSYVDSISSQYHA